MARTTVTQTTPQRSELVLIVEDEDPVRELAAEFMKAAGYKVLTARDGHEALGISSAQNSAESSRGARGSEDRRHFRVLDRLQYFNFGELRFNVGVKRFNTD